MSTANQPLELNETYRHFNSLIWQVPSWGLAIATGVIVAADQIGRRQNDNNIWTIPVHYVQASVLFFGFLLLLGLAFALYRYRAYQAASAPEPVPVPPFQQKPEANKWLQFGLCLTTGGIFGLAVTPISSESWVIIIGLILGFIGWIVAECSHRKVIERIKSSRANHITMQCKAP